MALSTMQGTGHHVKMPLREPKTLPPATIIHVKMPPPVNSCDGMDPGCFKRAHEKSLENNEKSNQATDAGGPC